MRWLRLIGLSCSRTQEAEDEIMLRYTADWGPGGYWIVTVLRTRTMDVGDSVTLAYEVEFQHAALLTLWEVDSRDPDDFIGDVLITPLYEGAGERTVTVERPGLGSYYPTFEVTRYRPEGDLVILRLLTLRCDDAQELEDEPVILVNGREVWRGAMRSGETQTLDLISEFRTEARIDLWERDPGRSDSVGTHVVERVLRGRGPQEAVFSRDAGIVGDATYRLRYQVE